MDLKLRSYSKDSEYSYSLGVYPTIELLNSHPDRVKKVILSDKSLINTGVQKIESLCKQSRIPVEVNNKLLSRLTSHENTYAVGVFEKYAGSLSPTANHVVLVNPTDTGNLGTIIRTMLGFNHFELAIISPGVDIFDPKTIRASMGALFRLEFHYFSSFSNYADLYPRNHYLFMTGNCLPLSQVKFSPPYSLVFGNEPAGLRDSLRVFGQCVSIPQTHLIDSLNLSVAAGIALYHASHV